MGITYSTCALCHDTFYDGGDQDRCNKHLMCGYCMPTPRPPDTPDYRDDDGQLLPEHCPVCKQGGTEAERAKASIAALRAELAEFKDAGRILAEANRKHFDSATEWSKRCLAAEAARDAAVADRDVEREWNRKLTDSNHANLRTIASLRAALRRLVFLKSLKDNAEKAGGDAATMQYYETEKPLAWAAARATIAGRSS